MKKTATLILSLGCALLAVAQPPRPGGIVPVTGAAHPHVDSTAETAPAPKLLEATFFPFTDANSYTADSTIIPIILAYVHLNEPDIQASQLNNYFARNPNPFLQSRLNEIIAKGRAKTEAEIVPSVTGVHGGGGLNLFPATQIIDGLGTFLADRFKKELTLAYLDQMKKQLEKANSAYAVSALLPETYTTFNHLEDIFNYKIYLNTLKDAVKLDVSKLPDHIITFADSLYRKKAIGDKISRNDYYTMLYGIYLFKESAFNGRNLLLTFTEARNNALLDQVDSNNNTRNALMFLSAFTGSYMQSSASFIQPNDINKLRVDSNLRKMYLGLALEKMRTDISPLKFIVKSGADTISGTELYIAFGQNVQALAGILTRFDHIRSDLQELQNSYIRRDSSDKTTLFLTTIQDFRLLLQQLQQVPGYGALHNYNVSRVLSLSDDALQLAQYVLNKQPGLAVNQVLEIMDSLQVSDTSNVYRFIEKYGPFVAALSDAKSGEEVAAALESAAMPVGSFRVKHHYKQNVSIQAYVGGAGGMERLRVNNTTDWKGVMAFSAPIGIAWSFTGLKKHSDYELRGYTSTLFFSVLDIGAVTALRLADSTTTLPELSFKNVLAPGFYYVGSFKNTPICFGIGAQYGPELRKVEDGNAVFNASGLRVGGFLTVDIPVFNIYNRGGNKK